MNDENQLFNSNINTVSSLSTTVADQTQQLFPSASSILLFIIMVRNILQGFASPSLGKREPAEKVHKWERILCCASWLKW
jgi:hypothetical protein